MMDATAEFYLETLERVFMDQQLAKGTLQAGDVSIAPP